jgi:hypothetical protein
MRTVHGCDCPPGALRVGCLLNADDVILLSTSASSLQIVLDVCTRTIAAYIDFTFNVKKSFGSLPSKVVEPTN